MFSDFDPDQDPGPEGRLIRFVFGAVAGAVMGVWHTYGEPHWVLTAAIAALLCGLLAMLFGDRFWRFLLSPFSWW